MAKGTMLDRLAGAMKTLSKREGKSLTPRQRVAAAQRWNSLADIGEDEIATLEALADEAGNRGAAQRRYVNADDALKFMNITDGNGFRADNPFLSDNIDKYAEQSDFLDWCAYHHIEPTERNLKQFRWETYKTLPYRERQWIANKKDVLAEHPEIRTRRQLDKMAQDEWEMSEYPTDFWREPYTSIREFPDDFDYMWRY